MRGAGVCGGRVQCAVAAPVNSATNPSRHPAWSRRPRRTRRPRRAVRSRRRRPDRRPGAGRHPAWSRRPFRMRAAHTSPAPRDSAAKAPPRPPTAGRASSAGAAFFGRGAWSMRASSGSLSAAVRGLVDGVVPWPASGPAIRVTPYGDARVPGGLADRPARGRHGRRRRAPPEPVPARHPNRSRGATRTGPDAPADLVPARRPSRRREGPPKAPRTRPTTPVAPL